MSETDNTDNTGFHNTGSRNTRHDNTGNGNTGNGNAGSYNTGNRNTGNGNAGVYNTGHRNTGVYNTGNGNTGHRNTGVYNTGNGNTGFHNTGFYNTGNGNTGHRNTGFYNTGNGNTGFFMTTTPTVVEVFNGFAVDREQFIGSMPSWLAGVHPTQWVPGENMTDPERLANPDWETTGGYLFERTMHQAFAAAWEQSDRDADEVRAMPGFDHSIWLEITGIDLNAKDAPTAMGGAVGPDSIVINGITYDRRDQ